MVLKFPAISIDPAQQLQNIARDVGPDTDHFLMVVIRKDGQAEVHSSDVIPAFLASASIMAQDIALRAARGEFAQLLTRPPENKN